MYKWMREVFHWGCIEGAEGPGVLACPKLTVALGTGMIIIGVILMVVKSFISTEIVRAK